MHSESVQVLKEITTVLHGDEGEFKVLEQCEQIDNEIKHAWRERHLQIKEEIAEWMSKCEAEDERLAADTESDETDEEVAKLTAEVEASRQHKETLRNKLQSHQATVDEARQEKAELEKKRTEVEKHQNKILPSIRKDVNLYRYITNIRWQDDAAPQEVKGYVCTKKSAKPFSLNKNQNSQYFTANYLWDLVEVGW